MAVDNQFKNFAPKPVYSSAHFMIELDGISKSGDALPTLRSIEGGGVKADVVSYQMGENGDIWRRIGKPKYDDIKIMLGIADASGFYGWIKEFFEGKHTRKNGAIIAADYNYEERARRKFEQAMIAGLNFPKWDANAKDQANITITLSPEKVVFEKSTGAIVDSRKASDIAQKHITACNFEFSIDGFEDACKRTHRIDPFDVKVKVVEHHHGTRLEALKIPGKIEVGNLSFAVPDADADAFRDLHNQRMAGKKNQERHTAKLSFYNNGRSDRGEIEFEGVHIFNVQSEKADASSEEMKLVKVECAVEKIKSFKVTSQ